MIKLIDLLTGDQLTSDPSKAIYATKRLGKFSPTSATVIGSINEAPPSGDYEYFISCQIAWQDLMSWLADGKTQQQWAESMIQSKNKFDESMARAS